MCCKKYIVSYSVLLAGILAVVSILGFPTPSVARIVNNEVLTIQLKQTDVADMIGSNLLTKDGQTVLLSEEFTELVVPIMVSGGDAQTEEKATITAETSDDKRLQAELDVEELELRPEGSVVHLTLKKVELIQGDVSGGDVSGGDVYDDEARDEGDASAEDVTEQEDISGNDSALGKKSTPEELFVWVELLYDEHTYQVTFLIMEKEESVSDGDAEIVDKKVGGEVHEKEQKTEELAFCPSQYYPTEKIPVINGQEQDCELSGFPPMTRYTLEEQNYLLYHGGTITVPAGKAIQIDLVLTGCQENLTLSSGSGSTYTVTYAEVPRLSENSFPLIAGAEKKELPIALTWGTLEPVITVEHLTEVLTATGDTDLIWKQVETVTFEAGIDDKLQIVAGQAEAGTYRAIVSWIENEITLYQMEIPFFIQYKVVIGEVQEDDQ